MSSTQEEIAPETWAIIEREAKNSGLPIDEYLRGLLPLGGKELALKGDEAKFEAEMVALADDTEDLPQFNSTYSREDIYLDHN